MDKGLIEELMVFVGLMALLGSLTKIVLTMVNRRKAVAKESAHGSLDDIAQRLGRILDGRLIRLLTSANARLFLKTGVSFCKQD